MTEPASPQVPPGAPAASRAGSDHQALLDVWPYPCAPQGARPRQTRTTRSRSALPGLAARAGHGPHPHPWGICLSGGGIRAASIGLGALQAMQRRHMLIGPEEDRATYLSAVSGGSYIAGAYTLLARQQQPPDGEPPIPPPMKDVPPYHRAAPPKAAAPPRDRHRQDPPPVTPEEHYLADHTLYLSHGPGGAAGALWHLVMGIVVNLLILGLVIDGVARPAGWAAGRLYPGLAYRDPVHGVSMHPWEWIVLAALGGAAVVTGLVSVMRQSGKDSQLAPKVSLALVALTGAWLAIAGLPLVLAGVRWLFGGAVSTRTVAQTSARLTVAAGTGGALSLGIGLTELRRMWARRPRIPGIPTKGARGWLLAHRSTVLNVLAAIAGPLLIISTFLLLATSAAGSAAAGGAAWRRDALVWAAGWILLVVIWFWGDLNAWSPHSYYYERLASVFAVGRQEPGAPDPRLRGTFDPSSLVPSPDGGGEQVGILPWILDHPSLQLSAFQPPEFPEVLICATANVSDYGSIPTGFNATSFVFSNRNIGGPLVGAIPIATYEKALGDMAINLPEAVSIAGAAVAPAMGKMTRAPLRFLLTLANVRLGVWVINPRRLDLQKDGTRHPRYPRPHYLFREMFGKNHLDAPYLYLSDGGHYENLGLVEQLRRGCEWIFCIDAAGDAVDTFHTLGDALTIARAELGVTIDITPDIAMAPVADSGPAAAPSQAAGPGTGRPAATHAPWVSHAHCMGTIHYPGRAEPGHLVYVKAGVPPDAPWDIKDFAEKHPGFPTDPTLDQFYDTERVEAYRALGEFITEAALEECWGDFTAWKAGRHSFTYLPDA